jgi:hypothetical protein
MAASQAITRIAMKAVTQGVLARSGILARRSLSRLAIVRSPMAECEYEITENEHALQVHNVIER